LRNENRRKKTEPKLFRGHVHITKRVYVLCSHDGAVMFQRGKVT